MDERGVRLQPSQAFCQQRRQQRLTDGLGDHRFLACVGDRRGAPARLQAIEYLVAGLAGPFRVAIRP